MGTKGERAFIITTEGIYTYSIKILFLYKNVCIAKCIAVDFKPVIDLCLRTWKHRKLLFYDFVL